jgi:hypothetical protein
VAAHVTGPSGAMGISERARRLGLPLHKGNRPAKPLRF